MRLCGVLNSEVKLDKKGKPEVLKLIVADQWSTGQMVVELTSWPLSAIDDEEDEDEEDEDDEDEEGDGESEMDEADLSGSRIEPPPPPPPPLL